MSVLPEPHERIMRRAYAVTDAQGNTFEVVAAALRQAAVELADECRCAGQRVHRWAEAIEGKGG